MKRKVLVVILLIFTASLLAIGEQVGFNSNKEIKGVEVWKVLDELTQKERDNAIIDLELNDNVSDKIIQEAHYIEEIWNTGNYNDAIMHLKESQDLEFSGVGIQWKNPEFRSVRWGDDVQIGTRDSIINIAFDVDDATEHLFAALLYQTGSAYNFCINMSTDSGSSWAETYNWTAFPNYEIDIDGVVYGDHFYLAYTYTSNTLGRIRRFFTSDGTTDATYGYVTVINEGVTLREVALASTNDYSPANVYYWAIMDNDSLRYYYSNVDVSSWYTAKPDVDYASRGLDACFDPPGTSSFTWASFIGTDDYVYAVERGPFAYYNLYSLGGADADAMTSIGAHEDTVIVFFPYYLSGVFSYLRYKITYNDGNSWVNGSFPSDTICLVDVTSRKNDGISAAYIDWTGGIGWRGMYRHRDYYPPTWTSPVAFSDNVPRIIVKPEIERIFSGVYGTCYAMYPGQTVYYDRSDWTGIEEIEDKESETVLKIPNKIILDGYLRCNYTIENAGQIKLSVYNVTGREIKILDKGMKPAGKHFIELNLGNLSSGTYFINLKDSRGRISKDKILIIK